MNQPDIKVGVLCKEEINFKLSGYFRIETREGLSGYWKALANEGQVLLENELGEQLHYPTGVRLYPEKFDEQYFTLSEVTIGVHFHWERIEKQSFRGALELQVCSDQLYAVNVLPLEDYLKSVISSEMSANSSPALLKAHAVISRSWLLAQMIKTKQIQDSPLSYESVIEKEGEYIRWYDREEHCGFDVCADDHCQRYQGISRIIDEHVSEAIEATRGQVLCYGDAICDARFSKCCGGVSEVFEVTWEATPHAYLQNVLDGIAAEQEISLKEEEAAEEWMNSRPDVFCNTEDARILSQVLNGYDQETQDFFRWTVSYKQQELSELIAQRTGRDFGIIEDLVPVKRGASGRLIKLKIVGSKGSLVIGKELEIRKTLSKSHLYSSAFVVEKCVKEGQIFFVLKGAGWGHGVGLCQIGAAVMGERGYTYEEILQHYFRGAVLEKKY